VPATDYVDQGLLEEPADKATKDAYAAKGFVHVPASGSPGGVVAKGGIRRDATLHLAALRLLRVADDKDGNKTLALRRYVLGLALAAFTYSPAGYLRQGCNLVLDPEKKRELVVVYGDGRRVDEPLTHANATLYAKAVAENFGIKVDRAREPNVLPDREVDFDKELAKKDTSGKEAEAGATPKKPGGRKAK
jgi:CRISPR-associated protein Csb1